MKNTVAAIDFGTSKIVTLVAENSSTQRCDIVGAGIAQYDGYLEQAWNNPGELDAAIKKSIEEAEKQSHRKLSDISVGVPGAFTQVYATEVSVTISGTEPTVSARDVQNCFAEAKKKMAEVPGIVIHTAPAWFMTDDGKKTLEPVGQKSYSLRALIAMVYASPYFVDEITNRLKLVGYEAEHLSFYSTAAGECMLYLPDEDRDHTSVLIDVGYLNTDVMIVEGDALLYHDVIEIGGGNIAADISRGLNISLVAAEQIKRAYVFGQAAADTTYDIPGVDGEKPVSYTQEQVTEVIEPCVDDIASMIRQSIEDSGVKLGNWSNIYMTGGGLAFNRGAANYLGGKLEKAVRDTPKRTTKLNSHVFSSTLGLMDLIIDTIEQKNQPTAGVGGGIRDFFRSLLG